MKTQTVKEHMEEEILEIKNVLIRKIMQNFQEQVSNLLLVS